MRKTLLAFTLILCFSQVANAAGYCPTNDEIQLKMRQFQSRAIKNMDLAVPIEQVQALNDEMTRYQESIVPNCIRYFQTTHNPDCSRLNTLSVGYMLLDKNKQYAAKGQILNVARPYQETCKYQYMSLEMMLN